MLSISMGKGDSNKLRGKMFSYAFFMQTCHKKHKKYPDSTVMFTKFSKKCSERWKTMSVKRSPSLRTWPRVTRPVLTGR